MQIRTCAYSAGRLPGLGGSSVLHWNVSLLIERRKRIYRVRYYPAMGARAGLLHVVHVQTASGNVPAARVHADIRETVVELVVALAALGRRPSSYMLPATQALVAAGKPGIDWRHLEAYMRLQYGTLGHLSQADFDEEARQCALTIEADPAAAEDLARSYGL